MRDNQIDTASLVTRLDQTRKEARDDVNHCLADVLEDAVTELIALDRMVDTGTAFAERVAEIVAKRVLKELRGEA